MPPIPFRLRAAYFFLLALCTTSCRNASSPPPPPPPPPPALAPLQIQGNRLLDSAGAAITLHGANLNGTQYACMQKKGSVFTAPTDQNAVDAIKSWKINALRIQLNEDCWLAINGAPAETSGSNYQQPIIEFVQLLEHNNIYPIISLGYVAPGTLPADQADEYPMPDADHSASFWASVVQAFRSDPYVIFDLYNEPYPNGNSDDAQAWSYWRDGGSWTQPDSSTYQMAGMQSLVTAIRNAEDPSVTHIITVPGVQYANALSHWLEFRPEDPRQQLAVSWHVYANSQCNSTACYESSPRRVAGVVPLIALEIGEMDQEGTFITTLMDWLLGVNGGFLAWSWNVGEANDLNLITDTSGTPSVAYGQTYQTFLGQRFP